ncbi:hypothetical protein ACFLWZ_08830, partial [Chloroflexota bacterium]
MTEILEPSDELRKRLHPHAMKRLEKLRSEIMLEIPQLVELTLEQINADIGQYLEGTEKIRIQKCYNYISDWLNVCVDISNSSSTHYPVYATWVISPMLDLKSLLIKTYRRKAEEAEKERMRLEREQRWHAAYEAVNPPDDDAKRYLDDEEYRRFVEAAREAIKANIEKGQDYLNDIRAFDYRWWLGKINERKEEEKQKAAARSAAQEYNKRLNKERERLRAVLYHNEQDHTIRFKKQIKDRRYTGGDFTQFLSCEEKQGFDNQIVDIGRKKLHDIVDSAFRQFINAEYFRSYYLLPSARYGFEGVPYLDFVFDIYAVLEVRVWLKPGQKAFGDYLFELPRIEEQGHSV